MAEKPLYTDEQRNIIQAIEDHGTADISDLINSSAMSKKEFMEAFPPFSQLASFSLLRTNIFDARLVWTKDEDNEEAPYFIFVSPDETKRWPSGKPICPKCGGKIVKMNKYDVTRIDDIPMREKKVSLLVLHKRYQCSDPKCKATFSYPLDDFSVPNQHMSIRHRRRIGAASMSKMSFEAVAYQMCVDDETVRKVFQEEVERRKKLKFLTPKHVGIDESKVHTAKSPTFYVCVLDTGDKDAANNGIIAIEEIKRTAENVVELFEKFDDLSSIETVSMDMCMAYKNAIEELNAIHGLNMRIIVDRFHLVKSLNDKFLDTLSNVYFRIKGDLEHKLGLPEEELPSHASPKPFDAIEEDDKDFVDLPFYFGSDDSPASGMVASSFDGLDNSEIEKKLKILKDNYYPRWFTMGQTKLSEKSRVRFLKLLKTFPEFESLYLAKEELRFYFFESDTADEARAIAEKAKATIRSVVPKKKERKALETYFTTLDDSEWTKHIYSYFDDPRGYRWSNAKVELFNSLVKEINAGSRGMTWEMLKNKLLYGDLSVKHRKSTRSLKKDPWMAFLMCMSQASSLPDITTTTLSHEVWMSLVRTEEMSSFLATYDLDDLTYEQKISFLKQNNNIQALLVEFAQSVIDKENVSEQENDSIEEVILPLRLDDWYTNEEQYRAILKADAEFLHQFYKD